MKLIHTSEDGKKQEVAIGFTFHHKGELLEVVHMPKPSKPSSTGKVNAVARLEGDLDYGIPYFAQVYNMKWIEREDQGWSSEQDQLDKIKDIYKDLFSVDMTFYTKEMVVNAVRDTYVSDFPHDSLDELVIVQKWVSKQ